ncbi:MAG: cell division protein FtsZ [Prevotellaceae bacterium]|jgi:cell division protein FtsZ|nr:cell division protein FtsZ [Prevotellaceae bacterium]
MEDMVEEMWGDAASSASIIKVVGVGGGGCNAVDHMYKLGIKDVGFVVCNTDTQALNSSSVPVKVQLGKKITEGLGAGSQPEQGRMAAEESLTEIAELMRGSTKMVFITAGMGGGTGTGAAPVIAKVAKDMGILTVAIVTIPFLSMEPLRIETAHNGIRELRKYVDSLLVVNNEKLLELYSDLTFFDAFAKADEVLCTAAKSIAEIITVSGRINVDFADVRTAMKDSGVALIGIGRCAGENRAVEAVNQAICSPLLNNNSIRGAKNVLINIMMGEKELKVNEVRKINEIVLSEVGNNSKLYIKTGIGKNPQLGEDVTVSIIATGFEMVDIDIPDSAEKKQPLPPASGTTPLPATPDEWMSRVKEPIDDIYMDSVGGAKPVRVAERGDILENVFLPDEEDDLAPEPAQGRGLPAPVGAGAVQVTPKIPPARGRRVPFLLDRERTSEELERPIRSARRSKASLSEGEISLFSFSPTTNRWESSSASYINGKPD